MIQFKYTLAAFLFFAVFLPVDAMADTSNKRDVEEVVATAQDLDTARNHDITVDQWDEVACQIVWTTASHTDATMTVQASIDGTNFETIAGTAYTLGTAAGNHVWQVSVKALAELRFAYAKGSNTTGTYVLTCRKEVPGGSEN